MPLRPNIANHDAHVVSQLVLNRQVVLRRILAPHMRLELSKQQNWTEYRPVHGLSPRRIEYSVKRIGVGSATVCWSSVLSQERQVELSFHGESTAAEWWL